MIVETALQKLNNEIQDINKTLENKSLDSEFRANLLRRRNTLRMQIKTIVQSSQLDVGNRENLK